MIIKNRQIPQEVVSLKIQGQNEHCLNMIKQGFWISRVFLIQMSTVNIFTMLKIESYN